MGSIGHAHHRNHPEFFQGRASRIYDWIARRLGRGVYRRLAADIAAVAPPDAAVLDVGTGPGVLLVALARRRSDLRLSGVDLSADMISHASRNLRKAAASGTVRVGDAADLPFPDESFDLIVSSLSLHHWDEPEAAASQLARVLRPGGRVLIYDVRFAPFDDFAAAAGREARFAGHPARRSRVRTGVPFLRYMRLELVASGS